MVNEVLDKASYSANVARRLHGLAAELGRVAGFACFDAGLHAAAQRYWTAAIYAAHAAGDRVQGANIFKSMSLQCYDFGLLPEALHLAQRARAGAGHATPRTNAMLALRQARACAALRQVAECERLIAAADTYLGHGTTDDDPAFIAYFDEAEFHAQTGSCYLDLGLYQQADDHLVTALKQFPTTKVRDRATYLTKRAHAQHHMGYEDEAAAVLTEVVPLLQQAPSQRNIERLLAARDRLSAGGRRRDLDEQLASLLG
ncbi:hypothetical protein ACWENQ_37410 [Nonomuraea sp. NPDC004354]